MTPSVSPEADRELTECARFYAREADARLAEEFLQEFERALSLLCNHPEIGARWREKHRRFSLRRFPYSIIYNIRGEELRVIAIAHHRRKPGYWQSRR